MTRVELVLLRRGRRKLPRLAQCTCSRFRRPVHPALHVSVLLTEHCPRAQTSVQIPGAPMGICSEVSRVDQWNCPRLTVALRWLGQIKNLDGKANPTGFFPQTWTTLTLLTHGEPKVSKKHDQEFLMLSYPLKTGGFQRKSVKLTGQLPEKPYNGVFPQNPQISSKIAHLDAIDKYGRSGFLAGFLIANYPGRLLRKRRCTKVRGTLIPRALDKLCSTNPKLLANQSPEQATATYAVEPPPGGARFTSTSRWLTVLDGRPSAPARHDLVAGGIPRAALRASCHPNV